MKNSSLQLHLLPKSEARIQMTNTLYCTRLLKVIKLFIGFHSTIYNIFRCSQVPLYFDIDSSFKPSNDSEFAYLF